MADDATTMTKEPASSGLADLAKEIDGAVEAATERLAAARDAGRNFEDELALDEDVEQDLDDGSDDLSREAAERGRDSSDDGSDEAPARDEHGRFAKKDTGEAESSTAGQPTEGTIERAVRLGIPLAEAKQFPSEALLAATCGRIEGPKGEKGKGVGSPEGVGAKKDGEEDPADLLSQIPDLDPSEFDERIVKAFAAVKGIAKKQQETIAELRGGQAKGWLDTKLEGVKDLTKGDQAKASALRSKFDVLKAGYRAAKQDVTDDAVFDEAARLVLGADMEALRKDKQAQAAGKRSGQRIQRPTSRRVEAKPDAQAEVADMLDRKFFS